MIAIGRKLDLGLKAAKYLEIAKISFLNRTAYLADVLFRSLFFVIILFIFIQLWRRVLGDGGDRAAGFGVQEMVWYMVMTETIVLSTPRIQSTIDEEVKSGSIAYLLNRPFGYLSYQLFAYWGEVVSRLPVNFIVGGAVAAAAVGLFDFQPSALPYVLLTVILALVLNFYMLISIGLAAFWVEDTAPFYWIYQKILFIIGGLIIPLDVYPEFLQKLSKWLPFNYILWGPARLFVRFDTALLKQVLLNQAIWIGITGALAHLIYRRGVRKVVVHGG